MPAHDLALALRSAYLAMHRATDASLARHGITADQFVVLAELSRGTALMQRELVARASSDPNTVRAMLVLLERRGLVERRPHPTDGRARSVAITRKGRVVFKSLWQTSRPVRTRLVRRIDRSELATLTQQLRALASDMQASKPRLRTSSKAASHHG